MKKSMLALSLLVLTACGAGQPESQEPTVIKVTKTNSSSESPTSNSETMSAGITHPAYEQVLSRYRASLGKDAAAINHKEVNPFLTILDSNHEMYETASYVQTDFDKDGTEDLAIALGKENFYQLIDLYTIGKDGDLLRLTDQFLEQGSGIGFGAYLNPLLDGSYSLMYRRGRLFNYRYDAAAKALVLVGEDLRPAEDQDLLSFNWQPLQAAPSPAPSTSAANSSKELDIDGLVAGDFSSIVGTWRNEEGHDLVLDARGVAHPDVKTSNFELFEGGYLRAEVGSSNGGYSLVLFPVGVEIPSSFMVGGTDLTDKSRIRIIAGNGLNSAADVAREAYYRVD